MRVLLSDGSGLTARQVATQLAAAGHTVEVLTPDRFALTRFTRHVAAVHEVPAYGADPLRWLEAALAVLSGAKFDVLLPTQEQAAVLSLSAERVRAAILTPDGPCYIDVNPRLVEPANAWWSGVDLVDMMLRISVGESPAPVRPGRSDVRTHQLLLAVLAAAAVGRAAVIRELLEAARGRGPFQDSHEELTPLHADPLAAVPLLLTSVATLVQPRAWRRFATGAVTSYALTPRGWKMIVDAAATLST